MPVTSSCNLSRRAGRQVNESSTSSAVAAGVVCCAAAKGAHDTLTNTPMGDHDSDAVKGVQKPPTTAPTRQSHTSALSQAQNLPSSSAKLSTAVALGLLGLISLLVLSLYGAAELAVMGAWNLHVLILAGRHVSNTLPLIPAPYTGSYLLGWTPALAVMHLVVWLAGYCTSPADSAARPAILAGVLSSMLLGVGALLPGKSKEAWNTRSGKSKEAWKGSGGLGDDTSSLTHTRQTASTLASSGSPANWCLNWSLFGLGIRVCAAVVWWRAWDGASYGVHFGAMLVNAVIVCLQFVGGVMRLATSLGERRGDFEQGFTQGGRYTGRESAVYGSS